MPFFSIIHKHVHSFDQASAKAFGNIQMSIAGIQNQLRTLMIDTSKLLAAVAREKTDNDSLRALVVANTNAMSQLSSQLADAIAKLAAGTDTTALDAVQADLDKATTDLSLDSDKSEAALAASVPATPPTAPASSSAPPTTAPADNAAPQPLGGTSTS